MQQTGRSYDYYDMFTGSDEETEKNPKPKPDNSKSDDKNEANGETDRQNLEKRSSSEFVLGSKASKDDSKNSDKDPKTKLESKGSQEKSVIFDPSLYMKVTNKASGENKRNSSTSTEFKDFKQELEEKVKSNITIEGSDIIYKMELIEGNHIEKSELKVKAPIDDGKPMFYIDPTPIAVFSKKNNEEIYVPAEKREKDSEKRYFVVGVDRFFKTQEKSLVEKLNKFLKKPDAKANGEQNDGAKSPEEVLELDPEMNNGGNRYFSHNIGEVCRRCKRTGHFERMCPEEVRIKCTYCTGPHNTDKCSQIICFVCFKSGHRAKDCKAERAGNCYRCGKRGHKREECGMLMLRETQRDKKDTGRLTKCQKCHKFGHITCEFQNLTKRGEWNDDLFEKQQDKLISIDAPKQKHVKREHVYYKDSSDEDFVKHGQASESESEDLDDHHLKSFLKTYSREELALMSDDEAEKELRKLRKQERFQNKAEKLKKKEKKLMKAEAKDIKKDIKKDKDRKRSKSAPEPKQRNGFRRQSKFVEKRIQEIKRDRKKSGSNSQPKHKKVKFY